MAPYDEWRAGPARGRSVPPQRRGGAGWRGSDGMSDYGEEWSWRPVHGPERYGLGPYYERLRRRRPPDDELQQAVEDALFYDTWVDAEAITVEVRDGVVTLRGELPGYDEMRYAIDDAWDVEGVVGVHSELELRR